MVLALEGGAAGPWPPLAACAATTLQDSATLTTVTAKERRKLEAIVPLPRGDDFGSVFTIGVTPARTLKYNGLLRRHRNRVMEIWPCRSGAAGRRLGGCRGSRRLAPARSAPISRASFLALIAACDRSVVRFTPIKTRLRPSRGRTIIHCR